MVAELILDLGLNALSAILILSIAALGLAIIFGFMGVINLAHGAFFTLGAYGEWFIATKVGIGFWPGLLFAPIMVGAIGYLTERLVVNYLYHRLLDTILATWAVSIVLIELLKILVGRTTKRVDNPLPNPVDLGITTYPAYRIFLMVFSLLLLIAVFGIFYRTEYGVRLRAVIQDAESAELLGINRDRMYQLSFSLGAALAGLAGAAVTPIVSVNPNMGVTYLIQSFLAIILGGTGTMFGILPGSIVVAGAANTMTYFMQPVVAQTIVFVFVIVALLFKPQGILGRS